MACARLSCRDCEPRVVVCLSSVRVTRPLVCIRYHCVLLWVCMEMCAPGAVWRVVYTVWILCNSCKKYDKKRQNTASPSGFCFLVAATIV